MYTVQSIHPKQNQKQIMLENNKLCIPQTGKKPLKVLKRIKTILSTFAMSIRWGKLTVVFSKNLLSCINYLQLLI